MCCTHWFTIFGPDKFFADKIALDLDTNFDVQLSRTETYKGLISVCCTKKHSVLRMLNGYLLTIFFLDF